MDSIVVFTLEGRRIGLPLDTVERAVRIVDPTPLPKAPSVVCGIINVQGHIVPVLDTRRRFGLPAREIELSDQLLIARTSYRTVALWVDAVIELVTCDAQDFVDSESVVPGLDYVRGIVRLADGLILVHDLDTFLSLEERQALDEAINDV